MERFLKLFLVFLLIITPVSLLGQKRQTADRTQPTKPVTEKTKHVVKKKNTTNTSTRKTSTPSSNSYFSISSTVADFESSGGSKTFTVNSSNSWKISTDTYTWGHLTRNGNSLTLRVDANSNSSSRTDYFVLSSGSKTLRVNISQKGSPALSLRVSSQNLRFSASGGGETFTVTSNGAWSVVDTGPDKWSNYSINGNQITISVDKNMGTSSRTDYITVGVGETKKRVNIIQEGTSSNSWGISGTSREYTDTATALSYLTTKIKEYKKCRLGAITENKKGIIIYGSNGASWSSIPTSFSDKMREISSKSERVSSVALTHSGYYCVVYERNAWYGIVPELMKSKLKEFNGNSEKIISVSVSENGNFAIVTDKHFYASNSLDNSNIKKAKSLYGFIKDVCVTNQGICVVCERGIYYYNIPTKLAEALEQCNFRPDHVVFTDSGTYLITNETEESKYKYYM